MTATLLYPFIIVAGVLQVLGNSMNARLRDHLVNPWLAATASFLPIVFVFTAMPGTRRWAVWRAPWRCSAG